MASLQHGTKYEYYVKQFLSNKYTNIWLWNEIPSNILHELGIINTNETYCDDIGCDILAQSSDNTYYFIQCKNYSTIGIDNVITISDLSGFYNFMAENNFTNGIIYYSGYLSSQVIKRSKSIKYINLPYKTGETINLIPHSYQIDAYNKLSISGRNVLTMPCGTGKTYVSYLLSANYKNIIILSPLISTAEQLYVFYKKYYNNTATHSISIFNCLNKTRLIDLKKNNVIISTYDSVNLILEKVSKLDNKIIIIDEYHNLSQNNLTNTDDYINKLLNYGDSSYLFMSATPHKLRQQYMNIFGNNEYTLGWEDAIKNKYICDYKFYYPNPDNVNVKIIELKKTTILSSLEVQKCILLNKAYYLLECIKESNVKKIIVFLKSLAESTEFTKIITLLNIFFENKLVVSEINCHTGKSERNKIITRFKNKNDTINILCNVHILDEGIDIPECDAVYLTHPNYNPINFIQRISRCNRIKPVESNISNTAHVFIWAKDENKVSNIDKLISEYLAVKHSENTVSVYIRDNNKNGDLAQSAPILVSNTDLSAEQIPIKSILSYSIFIEYLKKEFNINLLYDKNNNIWLAFNEILKIIGYSNIKQYKKRLTIDDVYFNSHETLFSQSQLNTIKQRYQKPNAVFINEAGIYKLLTMSSKTIAKKYLHILLTGELE
jgi:superfamily II DNA or RNA helicase